MPKKLKKKVKNMKKKKAEVKKVKIEKKPEKKQKLMMLNTFLRLSSFRRHWFAGLRKYKSADKLGPQSKEFWKELFKDY